MNTIPLFLIMIIFLIGVWCFYLLRWSLMTENLLISNLPVSDIYIRTNHEQIFLGCMKHDSIGYIVPYHNLYLENTQLWRKKLQGRSLLILDGEPNPIHNMEGVDAIITTKKYAVVPSGTPHIYLPYFVYSFRQIKIHPSVLIKQPEEKIPPKKHFCCFIYSNCKDKYRGVRDRKLFLERMQARTGNRVHNLGRCYNKAYKRNGWWQNNTDIYKDYKFVISFENDPIPGYISEKIWTPMLTRSIPIYLGAPDIDEFFNPRSFVHVRDYADFDACIDYILKIENDPVLYQSIMKEPYFPNNRLCPKTFSFYFGGEFYRNLKNILPPELANYIRPCQMMEQDVVVTIVADNQNKKKKSSLFEKAKASRFFKRYRLETDHDTLTFPVVRAALDDVQDGDLVFLLIDQPALTLDICRYKALQDYLEHLLYRDTDVITMQNRSDILMLKKTARLKLWMQAWEADTPHHNTLMTLRIAQSVVPLIHSSLTDMKDNKSCFVSVPVKKKN